MSRAWTAWANGLMSTFGRPGFDEWIVGVELRGSLVEVLASGMEMESTLKTI